MEFATAYKRPKTTPIETGERIRKTYGVKIKNGKKTLEVTGKYDQYELIQASLEQSKIENILERLSRGDESDFTANAQYIDTTKMPKTLSEAQNMIIELQNTWYGLPLEIRKKYDNSMEKFIDESGSESWMINMGYIKPKKEEITTEITKGEKKDEQRNNNEI